MTKREADELALIEDNIEADEVTTKMAATERGPCMNILSPVKAAAHDKKESEGKLSTQSSVETEPDNEDQNTVPEDAATASEANEKKQKVRLWNEIILDTLGKINDMLRTRPIMVSQIYSL